MLSNFNLSAQSGRAGPRERMTSMTGTIADIDDQRKQAISCAVSLADYS